MVVKMKNLAKQVGPSYEGIKSDVLDYDEVFERYEK